MKLNPGFTYDEASHQWLPAAAPAAAPMFKPEPKPEPAQAPTEKE